MSFHVLNSEWSIWLFQKDEEFGIPAKTKYYAYMIKLLGIDYKLGEAKNLIKYLQEPVNTKTEGAVKVMLWLL